MTYSFVQDKSPEHY